MGSPSRSIVYKSSSVMMRIPRALAGREKRERVEKRLGERADGVPAEASDRGRRKAAARKKAEDRP